MMQGFPDLVEIHKGAMKKVRDADKMKEEGRIDVSNCIVLRCASEILPQTHRHGTD